LNTEQPGGQPPTTDHGRRTQLHQPQGVNLVATAASALRISTGVVALVLSVVGIIFAGMLLFVRHSGASTPFNGWMNFFLIVGSIGCLVTGIVILAKQRKRGGATPWLVASFAVLVVVACLVMAARNTGLPGATVITLPAALAVTVLAVLVIVKEKTRGMD
jgi:hypothetical protein